MRRELCGLCMASDLQLVLDLGTAPLADEFPTSPALDQARYPLQLYVCQGCGLAQLGEVVDDKALWGGDYAFYSGASATIRDYYQRYAGWLVDRYGQLMTRGPVVEIACNDGTLLRAISVKADYTGPLIGIDPAAGPAKVAQEHGLDVHVAAFSQAFAEQLIDDTARRPRMVVANNVAAHVADPVDFFAGIAHLLHPAGVALIEVQYLPDLLLGNDYPLLYHEHRSYYSLSSLVQLTQQVGLTVTEAWLTEPQGGSLRVELRHQHHDDGFDVGQGVSRILTAEQWLRQPGAYSGLQGRAERLRARLLELLFDEALAGRTVAGYGASAKASTLLAWCGLNQPPQPRPTHVVGGAQNSQLVSWFVDTTPSKIGRYMPGTAIPVVGRTEGPDAPDGPDTYLLCIWNYLGHVLRQEAGWLSRSSAGPPGKTPHRMILPVPVPKVI